MAHSRLGGFIVFWLFAGPYVPAAFEYPKEHVVKLAKWISAAMKWLIDEASFGLFSFTDLTRFISAVLDVPYTWRPACSPPAFWKAAALRPSRSCRPCPG
jgi:glycine betaine/proline transport system permease protein